MTAVFIYEIRRHARNRHIGGAPHLASVRECRLSLARHSRKPRFAARATGWDTGLVQIPKRRITSLVALAALVGVPVGVGVLLLRSSAAKGPATYAQIAASGRRPTVDVWQIRSDRKLIFEWKGDTDALTFNPADRALMRVQGGAVSQVDHYHSNAAAWAAVKVAYGVSHDQVDSALAAGTRSAAPAAVRIQPNSASGYGTSDYRSNFKALSAAIGFPVPELTTLDAYPLLGSSVTYTYGPGKQAPSGPVASINFGNKQTGNSAISIDIARRSKPGAWGTTYAQMYTEKRFHHFPATARCPPYTLVSGDAVTPYGAEWMGVHIATNLPPGGWCRLLRTIERH